MDTRESYANDSITSIWPKKTNAHKNGDNHGVWHGLRVFQRKKKPAKRSIGVGDAPACSSFRADFWNCFLKKDSEMRLEASENESLKKNSEVIAKFMAKFEGEKNAVQKEIISSAIASILSTFISHPFDVIQSKYLLKRHVPHGIYYNLGSPRISFIVQNIIKTKGWLEFYKGHNVAQCEALAQVISMFLTYQQAYMSAQKIDFLKDRPSLVRFSAGFISTVIPVMVLHPLAIYRARRHSYIASQSYKLNPKYTKKVSLSIFYGCLTLFLHMGTQYGLRFLFYNEILDEMIAVSATHEKATSTSPNVSSVDSIFTLSHLQLVVAGGSAAILSDLLTHPFNVIHRKLMMSSLRRQQYKFEQTCRRFSQCCKVIVKTEGILALYAGILPQAIRSMVNISVQFAVYDRVKHLLRPIFPT